MSLAETVRTMLAKHGRILILDLKKLDEPNSHPKARASDRYAACLSDDGLFGYGYSIQEAVEAADRGFAP